MLKYNELSSNKQTFVDWLATPDFAKKINTQRELSKKLGVSEVTLSRWKKDEDIIKMVTKRKKELAGVELLPRVIDAIAVRATKTNKEGQKYATKDAELFLKWFFGEDFGGGVDVNVSQTNYNNEQTPPTEKLAKRLAKIKQRQEDTE